MFKAYYCKNRFNYIHKELSTLLSEYNNVTLIKKTACLYSDKINVYIDTSDGVNEDLNIYEYCGRIKKVVDDSKGKKFLFFKAAYSSKWTKNIEKIAEENNGKIIPFFKWSFNSNFYSNVFNKKDQIREKYKEVEKTYDIGYFCSLKPYDYPKPSEFDELISWPDHKSFNLPGNSRMTGNYENYSRKKIYDIISNSNFSVLFPGSISYNQYIENSFKCKVILNPPGIGEYTSRMFDHCYLGNCIVMRENSYDQGHSWKNFIKEIDVFSKNWEDKMSNLVQNYKNNAVLCEEYFNNYWTPDAIIGFMNKKIQEEIKNV